MAAQTYDIPTVREDALKLIYELREKYGDARNTIHQANEAKTRLLIINKVLNALGWNDEQFNPEEPTKGVGYSDYLLKIEDIPRLVVEAKKAAHTFRNLTQKQHKDNYTLKYLRSAFGSALSEVIDQAETYARQYRLRYALLTNGAEWILIQVALSPGFRNLDDLRCYYFGNLFTDDFRFDAFWDLLYVAYVAEGSLEVNLGNLNSVEADFSKSPSLDLGELRWQKPSDDRQLSDFYDFFFTEITDTARRRMLELCYVSNSELDQYQKDLNRALRDSAPDYIENGEELIPDTYQDIFDPRSGDRRGNVVLVTGSVGCGKSTFVNKVISERMTLTSQKGRSNSDEDVQREAQTASDSDGSRFHTDHSTKFKSDQQIYLLIDLINEIADESDDTVARLWQTVYEKWLETVTESHSYEQLTRIFGYEISVLKSRLSKQLMESDPLYYERKEAEEVETLFKDHEKFVTRAWQHYRRKKNRGIVLFFDNVDRASEKYQRLVYSFAHKLSDATGATVVITMREATFFRGKNGGFLDVRGSDKVFHLQTPNLEQVLSKRIRYVTDYIETDPRQKYWKKAKGLNDFVQNSKAHADKLKEVFLNSPEGRDKLSVLASIAWHDVRYFLDLLKDLHTQFGSGNIPWSLPEIVAVLATPVASGGAVPVIANVYIPPFPTHKCYFLKLRLLLFTMYGVKEHEVAAGISINKILKFALHYGYQQSWILKALAELVQSRLLECLEIPSEREYTREYQIENGHSYRRSPLAVVLVQRIISLPIYLCLIGNELPYHKQSIFNSFKRSLEEVIDILEQGQLDRDTLSLLTDERGILHTVCQYLFDCFENEPAPANLMNYIPEIRQTEQRLDEVITLLNGLSNQVFSPEQLSLGLPISNFELYDKKRRIIEALPIPPDITHVRVDGSEQASLIFWSLVALKTTGQDYARGSEITRIINEYLVDDYNQKAPTNISRALRSPKMQNQRWLVTKPGPLYGLADEWRPYWETIFNDQPPSLQPST